jgi:hypothetical protein
LFRLGRAQSYRTSDQGRTKNHTTDGIAAIERMLLGEQQTNRILLMTFPYGNGPAR